MSYPSRITSNPTMCDDDVIKSLRQRIAELERERDKFAAMADKEIKLRAEFFTEFNSLQEDRKDLDFADTGVLIERTDIGWNLWRSGMRFTGKTIREAIRKARCQ